MPKYIDLVNDLEKQWGCSPKGGKLWKGITCLLLLQGTPIIYFLTLGFDPDHFSCSSSSFLQRPLILITGW